MASDPKRPRYGVANPAPDASLPYNLYRLFQETNTDELALLFAQKHGLLPSYGFCGNCNRALHHISTQTRRGRRPQYMFQCQRHACKRSGHYRQYIRKGTWFEGSHVSLQKSLTLVYCFVHKFSVTQALLETSLHETTSSETVGDLYSYCREVCLRSLSSGDNVRPIGGPNMTVEIDEAKFGKRKFHRGRHVEGHWVLGGICRETKECFLVPVDNQTEDTFLGHIRRHVRIGSIIHTDCSRSYNRLSEIGYQHFTVNHSENFVDPQTGACTNTIEGTWWAIRRTLPCTSTSHENLGSYLAEYLWRRSLPEGVDKFIHFLKAVAHVYPGQEPLQSPASPHTAASATSAAASPLPGTSQDPD